MNVKLKNRKDVQKELSTFVGGVAISPELIETICGPALDDGWLAD